MRSAETPSRGTRLLSFVASTAGCTIVAVGIPMFLAGAVPTHVRPIVLIFSALWMYFCAFKFAAYFANHYLYDRPDQAEFQVLGAAVYGDSLRRMKDGKVPSGGGNVGWPFAKLSVSHDMLRVQTSLMDFSWDKAERPLIVRSIGWEIRGGTAGETGDVMFYTSPWKAVTVERKLAEFGYAIQSRYVRDRVEAR